MTKRLASDPVILAVFVLGSLAGTVLFAKLGMAAISWADPSDYVADVLAHAVLGAIFASTGFLVRGACNHRGWLPHPAQQIALTAIIVLIEAAVTVPIVG